MDQRDLPLVEDRITGLDQPIQRDRGADADRLHPAADGHFTSQADDREDVVTQVGRQQQCDLAGGIVGLLDGCDAVPGVDLQVIGADLDRAVPPNPVDDEDSGWADRDVVDRLVAATGPLTLVQQPPGRRESVEDRSRPRLGVQAQRRQRSRSRDRHEVALTNRHLPLLSLTRLESAAPFRPNRCMTVRIDLITVRRSRPQPFGGLISTRTPMSRTARTWSRPSSSRSAASVMTSTSPVGDSSVVLRDRVMNGAYRTLSPTRIAGRPSAWMSSVTQAASRRTSRSTSLQSVRWCWNV